VEKKPRGLKTSPSKAAQKEDGVTPVGEKKKVAKAAGVVGKAKGE